jgi:small subunit ribosomal protein S20
MDNARKALRQSLKNAQRNKIAKAEIDSMRVKLRKFIDGKKMKEAETLARELAKKLDKAHAHGILKKNTVARYKSRFMRKLHAVKA